MTPGDSFSDTLAAARAGDQSAWAQLYRSLSPIVLGYLRARGAAEPEDVTGEVFLQAVRDLHAFEGDERAFRAWVLRIAHHRLLDAARHSARRPVDPAPEQTIVAGAGTADAEQEAVARLEAADVTRLLGTLSADQQSVVLLRVLGGLSVPEVARAIGKRQGAVKQLQRRAFARLRKDLESDPDRRHP